MSVISPVCDLSFRNDIFASTFSRLRKNRRTRQATVRVFVSNFRNSGRRIWIRDFHYCSVCNCSMIMNGSWRSAKLSETRDCRCVVKLRCADELLPFETQKNMMYLIWLYNITNLSKVRIILSIIYLFFLYSMFGHINRTQKLLLGQITRRWMGHL